jgi:hypothetical protein
MRASSMAKLMNAGTFAIPKNCPIPSDTRENCERLASIIRSLAFKATQFKCVCSTSVQHYSVEFLGTPDQAHRRASLRPRPKYSALRAWLVFRMA